MTTQFQVKKQFLQKMKSSEGVSSALGFKISQKQGYDDQLDKFTKDYAVIDKKMREQEMKRKQTIYQSKRKILAEKQTQKIRQQQQKINKYYESINRSLNLHGSRLKKTAHTNSMPYNPITMAYQNNHSGREFKNKDELHKVKQLVRAHNLQTRSTSGYNLINGATLNPVQNLVPKHLQSNFGEKLKDHYRYYKIRANSLNQI